MLQVVKYMKEKSAEAERQRQKALERARGENKVLEIVEILEWDRGA